MYVHNTKQSESSGFRTLQETIPAYVFGELKCSTYVHKYLYLCL